MDHRQGQGEKDDLIALDFKRYEPPLQPAVYHFHGDEHWPDAQFKQVVIAAVHHPELQTVTVSIWRNQKLVAEADARRRPGETPEEDAGREGEAHQPGERLNRCNRVCSNSGRIDTAVAYRCQRMRAEKECVQEAQEGRGAVSAL